MLISQWCDISALYVVALTDSKSANTKHSFYDDLEWMVLQLCIYHINTLQYLEMLRQKQAHKIYSKNSECE